MLAVFLGFFGFSLLLIFTVAVVAPGQLEPLKANDAEMHRLASAGFFPLVAAASAEDAITLAFAAGLQTFACFALWFFAVVYFGRKGLLRTTARSWSNAPWIIGVVALSLIPSIFSGVTLPLFDYAITASISDSVGAALPPPFDAIYGPQGLNARMSPAVFLAERGVVGGLFAAALAFLAHDVGYRLREALEDFGLIDVDETRQGSAYSGAAGPGRGARRPAAAEEAATHGAAFGHRGAPPSAEAQSPEARARAVLGVGVGASKREIERAYRAQMKRAHPDHGGSVERAAALNAARDALLRRG